jgi:hypothetical protein
MLRSSVPLYRVDRWRRFREPVRTVRQCSVRNWHHWIEHASSTPAFVASPDGQKGNDRGYLPVPSAEAFIEAVTRAQHKSRRCDRSGGGGLLGAILRQCRQPRAARTLTLQSTPDRSLGPARPRRGARLDARANYRLAAKFRALGLRPIHAA